MAARKTKATPLTWGAWVENTCYSSDKSFRIERDREGSRWVYTLYENFGAGAGYLQVVGAEGFRLSQIKEDAEAQRAPV